MKESFLNTTENYITKLYTNNSNNIYYWNIKYILIFKNIWDSIMIQGRIYEIEFKLEEIIQIQVCIQKS